jgi:hypothetical protein
MAQQQISPGSINAAIAALRLFFTVTLERPDLVRPLTTVNKPRKAPVVLSEQEVARLLEAALGLKYKAALSVAYGAGLRVSEVANLKVSDIDSQRMTLRVEQGKVQRDRYVMLSPQLLELLRDWWRAARPQAWLFPSQNPINPMSARQLGRRPRRGAGGQDRQARLAAHLAAQLRAFQNKAAVYDLLCRTAAETLTTIAADPKHLGARIGLTAVLHTWGSALTHHRHVHAIVPGGGRSPDGARWIPCKPGFFLPVRVLLRLFRRLFLEGIAALHKTGRLALFGGLAPLADKRAFDAALAPLRRSDCHASDASAGHNPATNLSRWRFR